MMKKILCVIFCMLMTITVIPATSFPVFVSSEITSQIKSAPPIPGDMTITRPNQDLLAIEKNDIIRPGVTISSINDIVIDILEQVDESLFLGYLEDLVSFGPRYTGTSSCVAAAEYIYNQFESMGLNVQYLPWTYGSYSSNNVEATMEGVDTSSDDIYIICAHYDTVAVSPGADDDGSGTAAVLTAAYVMSQYQFNYTIKFVAFSGEEQGLLGSEVYAAQAAAQGWDIIGVLNADMISYAITQVDGNNLIVYENSASEWLYTFTNSVNTQYYEYIHLTLQHGGYTWGSDHNSFWDHGYDALFYFEYTETPYYHTSGDTLEHVNITYATKNSRLIIATLAELSGPAYLSNAPNVPTITGPTIAVINEECTYTVVTIDPDGDDVYYYINWGDGNTSGWLGPYISGAPTKTSHTWIELGSYQVKVKAKDIWGATSSWSEPLIVTIVENTPPNAPTINGPTKGKVGETIPYEINATDPNGHGVYFFVFWGDGTDSGWIGPYNSSEVATINHIWTKKGTYTISAKARDVGGYESDWTIFKVTIPRTKLAENSLLLKLFERLQSLRGEIPDFTFIKNLIKYITQY